MSKRIRLHKQSDVGTETGVASLLYDEIFLNKYRDMVNCFGKAILVSNYDNTKLMTIVPAKKLPTKAIAEIIINHALLEKYVFAEPRRESRNKCFNFYSVDEVCTHLEVRLPFCIDLEKLRELCHSACKQICPNKQTKISIKSDYQYTNDFYDAIQENGKETRIEITIYNENPVPNN
jgi:hypothetical protein